MSKPAFDPSKPFEIPEKPAFDPSKPFDAAPTPKKQGMGESILHGLEQGTTFGLFDEISGAGEGLGKMIGLKGLGGPMRDIELDKPTLDWDQIKDAYKSRRDLIRQSTAQGKKDNPKTMLASEIAGGLLTGGAATKALGLAVPKTIGQIADAGGRAGLLAGFGASEAKDVGGMMEDTAKSGALGWVLGLGGASLSKGIGNLAGKVTNRPGASLKKFAEKKAFESLGGGKAAVKEAGDSLQDTGRYLLDNKIVTPLAGKETVAQRIGDKLGSVSGELDDIINKAANSNIAKFHPEMAAEQVKAQLAQKYPQAPKEIMDKMTGVVDEWFKGKGPMGIKDVQNLKLTLQKFIPDRAYQKDLVGRVDVLKSLRRAAKEGVENMGNEFAEKSGQAGGRVKALNQEMGNLLRAEDAVQEGILRDTANRSISLTDTIAGAGGISRGAGAIADGLTGAAFGAANKAIRHKGDQLAATSADAISKMLLKSPQMANLAQRNPNAFKSIVSALTRRATSAPEALSKVADTDSKSGFASQNVPAAEAIDRYKMGN